MNLCGGRLVGSMALPISNPTRQPFAAFPKYPAGLRVLVVGDDPTCLRILERMLQACQFEVTKCDRAEHALNELRKNKSSYDIVLSDVYMRGMGGFKLLEHIGLEIDLPVVMISADDSKKVVLKAVKLGACDYLIKPVRIETLINIWQHVVRKKKDEWKAILQSRSVEEAQKQEGIENSSLGIDRNRVVWSIEFHQQFVAAVNQLGIDKAVPMEILEMINVPGLTRESVASHLQKYRSHLKMVSEISQHQGGLNGSFMSPQARPGQLMNESSVGSQTPSYVSVDFSPNQLLNGSPLRSTLALTTSKGIIQEEVKSNLKGLKGFGLNYMYNLLINNPLSKVKTEKDQFARNDLMSLILKQVWLPILLVLCIGVLLHLSK